MSYDDKVCQSLLKRYERLKSERGNFETLFQDVADYVLPRKSNITMRRSKGEKQTEKLFDSTGMHANNLLASAMQSTLTNPSVKWFSLRPRNKELQGSDLVKRWLADVTDAIFFQLQISNFESESHEVYLDLGAFGTSCMFMEAGKRKHPLVFGGFVFKTFDISEYVFSENDLGIVDAVYRSYRYTAEQAVAKFGMDVVHKDIAEAFSKSPYTEFEFLHAVYPRESAKADGLTADEFPYASVYVDLKHKMTVKESGYLTFPALVPRWSKTAGEQYGRSPGMIALPDIRSQNKARELGLKNWAKKLDPPIEALDDGWIGSIRTVPGSINIVREIGALKPMDFGGDLNASFMNEDRLRFAIERVFFVDQLQLPPAQGTPMTATETERRVEQMYRILGPVVGRLRTEWLAPMVDRAFSMMLRDNALPMPPQEVIQLLMSSPVEFDVEFIGPLARAQRATDVMAMQRWLEASAPFLQIDQRGVDNFDVDYIVRTSGELLGAPPMAMRMQEDVEAVREERAKMVEDNVEREQEAVEADSASKVISAVK